jgi:hypothetical protein
MDFDVNVFMEDGRTQMRDMKAAKEVVKSAQEAVERLALRTQRRNRSTAIDNSIEPGLKAISTHESESRAISPSVAIGSEISAETEK